MTASGAPTAPRAARAATRQRQPVSRWPGRPRPGRTPARTTARLAPADDDHLKAVVCTSTPAVNSPTRPHLRHGLRARHERARGLDAVGQGANGQPEEVLTKTLSNASGAARRLELADDLAQSSRAVRRPDVVAAQGAAGAFGHPAPAATMPALSRSSIEAAQSRTVRGGLGDQPTLGVAVAHDVVLAGVVLPPERCSPAMRTGDVPAALVRLLHLSQVDRAPSSVGVPPEMIARCQYVIVRRRASSCGPASSPPTRATGLTRRDHAAHRTRRQRRRAVRPISASHPPGRACGGACRRTTGPCRGVEPRRCRQGRVSRIIGSSSPCCAPRPSRTVGATNNIAEGPRHAPADECVQRSV
jgi:hypothetical protein